jgi:hypothetical protein
VNEKLQLVNLETDIEKILFKSVETPLSLEEERQIGELETKRNHFLRPEEEAWKIQSRVTWIKRGDSNTNFFHNMASFNRNRKHVWEIQNGSRDNITDQKAIKEEVVNHFKHFFKSKDRTNYNDLVRVSILYPRMVNEEEVESLFKPVTLEEIKYVLENFKK